MKPLSEWTEEDLIAELTHPRASGPHQSDRRAAALAELLRRERERCAKECEAVISEVRAENESALDGVPSWLAVAADRIRGLQ